MRQIATALDRAPSSVSRELKRNGGAQFYKPVFASQQSKARRWTGSKLERNDALREVVLAGLTFVAALRLDGMTAPFTIRGPINRDSLEAYVEQVLLPTLRPRDVVIMDNLNSHKGRLVRDMIPQGWRVPILPASLFARHERHRAGLRQD